MLFTLYMNYVCLDVCAVFRTKMLYPEGLSFISHLIPDTKYILWTTFIGIMSFLTQLVEHMAFHNTQ